MSNTVDVEPSQITVHTFSQNVMDTRVFYQVMKMTDSFHIWIGTKPCLENMSLAMPSKYDSVPLASHLFGDNKDQVCSSLAQKLAKRTGKQVFVSCNLAYDQLSIPEVEKRIVEEMKAHPEKF